MSNFPAYLEHEVNCCDKCGKRWIGKVKCPKCAKVPKSGKVHYQEYEVDYRNYRIKNEVGE